MNSNAALACLPNRAGIGLKLRHMNSFLERQPEIGFVEVHAENYMVDGGVRLAQLEAVRANYPLSIHGVAASLGADAPLDKDHLHRLKRLVERFEPQSFSEHLAWSTHAGVYYNDLLPVTYDLQRLDRVVEHIDQLQSYLGRKILLENPASYVQFKASNIPETEFLSELIKRSGCGLLLDLNNVVVSCANHGWCPEGYLRELPREAIGEVHLAGFTEEVNRLGERLLIDSHDTPVAPEVWSLYEALLMETGPVPVLLERDGALPELDVLLQEAHLAEGRVSNSVFRNVS